MILYFCLYRSDFDFVFLLVVRNPVSITFLRICSRILLHLVFLNFFYVLVCVNFFIIIIIIFFVILIDFTQTIIFFYYYHCYYFIAFMRGSTEYCMNRYAEEISTILLTS